MLCIREVPPTRQIYCTCLPPSLRPSCSSCSLPLPKVPHRKEAPRSSILAPFSPTASERERLQPVRVSEGKGQRAGGDPVGRDSGNAPLPNSKQPVVALSLMPFTELSLWGLIADFPWVFERRS